MTFGKIIVVCSENQFKLTNNFSARNIKFLTLHSGICYYHPGQQSPKRGRINTLNEKLDFMLSTDFAGTFERKEKYVWVPFVDPWAIKILSLGAIWNFSEVTGLS
jgi:hypothetical protein